MIGDPAMKAHADGLLVLPFRGRVTAYVINRRSWLDEEDRRDA